jgi:excisionase family DNA binding protein
MDTSDRITAPIGEFCRLTGIGRSLVYELIGDGRLDSILIGRRRLIVIESYRRLVERQRVVPALTTAAQARQQHRRAAG